MHFRNLQIFVGNQWNLFETYTLFNREKVSNVVFKLKKSYLISTAWTMRWPTTVAHDCHGKTKSHGTTNLTHGKTKLTHGKTKLTHGKTKKTSWSAVVIEFEIVRRVTVNKRKGDLCC